MSVKTRLFVLRACQTQCLIEMGEGAYSVGRLALGGLEAALAARFRTTA